MIEKEIVGVILYLTKTFDFKGLSQADQLKSLVNDLEFDADDDNGDHGESKPKNDM